MRIYDTRLEKFLSVDPFFKSYPFYSPYHYAGNNPIKYVDLDGGEPVSPRSELKNIKLVHSIEKGNIVQGYFDTDDPMRLMNVEKVFDPIKKQAFFITQYNETNYYWNSTEDNLWVRRIGNMTESNGHWDKYQTEEQRMVEVRAGAPNVLLTFFAAGAVVAVAAPVAISATPSLLSAGSSYASEALGASMAQRAISVSANLGYQYMQNATSHGFTGDNIRNINITSVFLSAINPFSTGINAVGSNFGKINVQDGFGNAVGGSKFSLKSAAIGSAVDYAGYKTGDMIGAKAAKYMGFNPTQVTGVSNVLGSSIATPANAIADPLVKKQENP